jgi:trimeric autotransporter adhesin
MLLPWVDAGAAAAALRAGERLTLDLPPPSGRRVLLVALAPEAAGGADAGAAATAGAPPRLVAMDAYC